MSWDSRYPAPRRASYETEEEYQQALADWYDAREAAAEEYVERQMERRYDGER